MAQAEITIDKVLNEEFFSLVGLESITEDEKETILQKMNETVQARVYLGIMEKLDEDERTVMDRKNGDELLNFLVEKGFDLPEMVIEEALKYRLELAHLFQIATSPASEITGITVANS